MAAALDFRHALPQTWKIRNTSATDLPREADASMQRKLAAILAADVVGFSLLVGENETRALAALKSHRQDLIDPEIARSGGRIFKTTGDGVLAEFPSVVAAIECAVAIQRGMAHRNGDAAPAERLDFRIGINLDEVVVDDDDILGDGVNVASRLESIAEPGTICISGAVFEQVKNRVDLSFDDLGAQRLKNIAEPVHVYRINPAGKASGFLAPMGDDLPLPSKPSIAILPFANLSGDREQDYLADGLRLDVQAALVHASGLFLIAPAAVNQYRNVEITAQRVGREMGVRYILQGAVRRSGRRIRVTLELTDVVARQIVWAERYDCMLDDTFTVHDEIAAEVLKALDVKLASGDKWLLHSTVRKLEALDPFYRGLSHLYAGTKADNAVAREMFEAVARLQPDSPVGPAYLCFTYWADAFRGWADSVEARDRSLAQAALWAERAAKMNGSNGLAHIVLASIHLLNHRHDEALATCYKAVELRPNCPTANSYLANILHYCGRPDAAITKVREAIRITPVYPPWYMTLLAASYRDNGEIAKSISAAEEGIRLNLSDRDVRLILCSDYSLTGQRHQAQRAGQEIVAMEPMFSLAKYADSQPYKHEETLRRLIDSLREAGLPE
jgi:adenylate cyclase